MSRDGESQTHFYFRGKRVGTEPPVWEGGPKSRESFAVLSAPDPRVRREGDKPPLCNGQCSCGKRQEFSHQTEPARTHWRIATAAECHLQSPRRIFLHWEKVRQFRSTSSGVHPRSRRLPGRCPGAQCSGPWGLDKRFFNQTFATWVCWSWSQLKAFFP